MRAMRLPFLFSDGVGFTIILWRHSERAVSPLHPYNAARFGGRLIISVFEQHVGFNGGLMFLKIKKRSTKKLARCQMMLANSFTDISRISEKVCDFL